MPKDIGTKEDIRLLIDTFYERVRADDTIGYIFNDAAKVNWAHHLPVMYSFWEQIIFHTGEYRGNPMVKHQQLHQQTPLNAAHFSRWLELFHATVDELFSGTIAENTKQRALSIATMMQIKILHAGVSLK